VSSILNDAHDLLALTILGLEISADCLLFRSENPPLKLLVDHRHWGAALSSWRVKALPDRRAVPAARKYSGEMKYWNVVISTLDGRRSLVPSLKIFGGVLTSAACSAPGSNPRAPRGPAERRDHGCK